MGRLVSSGGAEWAAYVLLIEDSVETAKKIWQGGPLVISTPTLRNLGPTTRKGNLCDHQAENSTSRRPPNLQAGLRVCGRSPRRNVTNGPGTPFSGPFATVGVYLPGSVRSTGKFAPLGPAVPAVTVGPFGDKYKQQMQTMAVLGVPIPAGAVPKTSSESLEAQNEARAPSKKLGMQERQYSVADMRQMMRLKLTGQARSAKLAAEQVGIPTATTALKRFLTVIYRKTELVRAYFVFKSVENSYCRR